MAIVLDGTAGITTPEITSAGGPLVVNASAPDNSVVVDASGNFRLGTTGDLSAAERLTVVGGNIAVQRTSGITTFIGDSTQNGYAGTISNHAFALLTNSTERARIDSSGNLLVGTTSSYGGMINFLTSSSRINAIVTRPATNITYNAADFQNSSGTGVGGIGVTSSSTAYVTSSDYRLKENIAPMTGALAKVAALKPVTYTWKATGEADEGFIAHELQEVCPSAVTGEKDAVDADGKPVYQGIDTSFLVATLTAAIQEQQALINAQQTALESLTARVVALETQP